MAFFESYKQKNGNFITIEWTVGEWVLAKILGVLLAIYVIGWLAFIVPTLWLIFYFVSIQEQRFWLNVTAILTGIYFMVDYYYGLSCWNLIVSFFSPHTLEVIATYTMAITLTHLVLLIGGRGLYFSIKNNSNNASESSILTTLFIYTIIIAVGTYFLASAMIHLIPQHQFIQP